VSIKEGSTGLWTPVSADVCGLGDDFKSWDDDKLPGPWKKLGSSTHYGNQRNAACGFQAAPFCGKDVIYTDDDSINACKMVPKDLWEFPAGRYAAPTGNYYTQTGPPGSGTNGYMSCGECFEIEVDQTYTPIAPAPYAGSVTVQIADSCPCGPNVKWGCGKYSERDEIPGLGAFPPGVIHLDLSNPAMGQLSTGDPNAFNEGKGASVLATTYRRVACPIKTNMYMNLSNASMGPAGSNLIYTGMGFSIVNVAGAGSLFKVEIQGSPPPILPPGSGPSPPPPLATYCYQYGNTCDVSHYCNQEAGYSGCGSDQPNNQFASNTAGLCVYGPGGSGTDPKYFEPVYKQCASPAPSKQTLVSTGSDDQFWIDCPRSMNFTATRPQERYAIWQTSAAVIAPVRFKITDSKNRQKITDYVPADWFVTCPSEGSYAGCFYNLGVQFKATL
jgi:hypothetical protein